MQNTVFDMDLQNLFLAKN